MSSTTDRLDELQAQTAPLPWPVQDFYSMPGDQFQLLFALTQAYPLLRQEIKELEATVVSLGQQNAQFLSEHRRVVAGSTQLGRDLSELQTRHARETQENAESHRVDREEIDRLNGLLSTKPIADLAAEAVCASISSKHVGSGGAWGWYDGEALDAWRKAKAGER